MAALAAAYTVVAKLGLLMDAVSGFATLVWPATGVALAALLKGGWRLWPGVTVGAFVVNVWTGAPLAAALGIATGNTLEGLLGAYLLRRFARVHGALDHLRHAVFLIGPAALGSTAVSATFGVVSLRLGGIVRPERVWETWLAWWVGDALGALVVAPLVLAWSTGPRARFRSWKLVEAGAIAAALAVVAALVFVAPPTSNAVFRRTYMIFPPLIWAALRFGLRGATAVTFLISAIAIACTALGLGPFARDSLSAGLLNLQVFMAIAAATALLLGAAISERGEALRKREEVLAIVSHDLKNPLAVAQMTLLAMQKQVGQGDAWNGKIAVLQRSLAQMNLLIRDLLDLAAMDAGRLSFNLGVHDVSTIVHEAVERAQPFAQERKQTLRPPTHGRTLLVTCDRDRVLQVLGNLIDNALKFTPEGGTVSLELDRQESGNVRCSVTDTGPGIPATELRNVFERFWQAQPGARVGTGLGLSIVKGIVEAHGGGVWAESTPGRGSAFRFTLPAAFRTPAPRA